MTAKKLNVQKIGIDNCYNSGVSIAGMGGRGGGCMKLDKNKVFATNSNI